MTTAHKPTFHPAIGSANPGGYRYYAPKAQFSARDAPGQLKLKTRKLGQGNATEIEQRDLKAELLKKETEHFNKKEDERRKREGLPPLRGPDDAPRLTLENVDLSKYDDADDSDDDDDSDDSDDSDDDDEDEKKELERELARIRAEREAERLRKEQEEADAKNAQRNLEAATGNHLLNLGQGNFNVKRKWWEDSVFKNQSKSEPKKQKTFVNDTTRNAFHRKFLSKYMK
eukprot:CAMPEP_0114506554 /NCGR_PEP_ID=MMETSP0109-20121206/11489_1 /TAXON_ID=29199 /ORGANISM="Chlorarachnion reptans, Strain CCCM449" /LENGTH=228 /DNA_ID=CAMNT_0001685149 /DNA_START=154 /DNA_END=840 /DNA_ORIENTATION=-